MRRGQKKGERSIFASPKRAAGDVLQRTLFPDLTGLTARKGSLTNRLKKSDKAISPQKQRGDTRIKCGEEN